MKNRCTSEIINRIENCNDVLGFEIPAYVYALTFAYAKPWLEDDAKPSDWSPCTDEDVVKDAKEYMPFAWEKANNCRGISAYRSLAHYRAWLWLLGDDDTIVVADDYEYYGKDILVKVCEYLDLDSSQWDDGIRVNNESELGSEDG